MTEIPDEGSKGLVALPAGIAVPDDVLWQEVDGQVVLLEMNKGHYFALDPIGSRIWLTLLDYPVLAGAVEQLMSIFDVDERTLRTDLADLLDQMTRTKLLCVTV